MPALNFRKEFADKVESGEKRQSIRALRKDGRNPRPGQTLYLYTGQRTKHCRKLGEAICKSVESVGIEEGGDIYSAGIGNDNDYSVDFAKKDGFDTFQDFMDFFRKKHGLPFYGLLIKW